MANKLTRLGGPGKFGFLVELDLIHLNSTKKTGSEVTITQGE